MMQVQDGKFYGILDESVGFLMGVTYRKISNLFMQRLKDYGITSEQWLVLYCICERDGMMQKDIAERSGKDRPTTTRILDVLHEKGWIVKKAGDSDRRSFLVYATDSGKALIRETEQIERQTVREATAGITGEEYILLIKLLNRIGNNIDQLNKE
ncbi:MarR family winged helix-turn-helix transcriptional regulator [Paenibacillus thermotolerans]|uniref:MarR family winged helix-turn-helix transcriptional regulator n=1 Tax=Paenibacillus thermotolerans TaxID=3027807 RepID=UPI002367F458|nr:MULTISPECIES: MarR family transcriptional regulator [unclassified Paenibacillus]